MNKRYTWLFAILATGSLSAQRVGVNTAPHSFERPTNALAPIDAPLPLNGDVRAEGDTLFYEDFANGTDGNNGVGAWTTSGANAAVWAYDLDGPNGDFSSTTQRISSPTVANGFMIFDSNLANNGCTSCVSFTGALSTPTLDLSATPHAHLVYSQRARWCCNNSSPHFVEISLDGGNTWPTRIPSLASTQVTNDDPGTYSRYINLFPHIGANPASVQIRFLHDGGTVASSTHYHWQIDDVLIVESPNNDLEMLRPSYDSFVPNVSLTDVLEYTVYPVSQLREISLGSPVQNQGSQTATNLALTATVNGPGGAQVFTGTANLASLAPGAVDSSMRVGFTPPATVGTYNVNLSLAMDAEDSRPTDNAATKSFQVDQAIYAYDQGSRNNLVRNTDGNGTLAFLTGNQFYIANDATAYGIQVALARATTNQPGTAVGTVYDVVLFQLDDSGNFTEVGSSDIMEVTNLNELTAAGQARWNYVPFFDPVNVEAGYEYMAAVRGYEGNQPLVVAASGRAERITSLLQRPYESAPNWYIIANIPMVRLALDPSVGINDQDRLNGAGLGQNHPNPATDITTIPYELTRPAHVVFEVLDMTGKVVYTKVEGKRAAGDYRIQLSTADLGQGTYFYSMIADGTRITKRMVVLNR